MNHYLHQRYLLLTKFCAWAAIILFFLYSFFILARGTNAYITIHDNLDSEFAYLQILKSSGQLFEYLTNKIVEIPMGGVPRSCFRSGLNITPLLFYFFEAHVAYQLNFMLVHIVAFVGMFLLLQLLFFKTMPKAMVMLISALYLWVPFYHVQQGITVAGQPLLCYALLMLAHHRPKFWHYCIVGLFPFYSFFVVSLPFYLVALFCYCIYCYAGKITIHKNFYLGIVLLTCVYLIVEWPLINSIINGHSNYVSHRTEFNIQMYGERPSIHSSAMHFFETLFSTQYHAGKFFCGGIILAVIISLNFRRHINRIFYFSLSIIVLAATSVFFEWFLYYFQHRMPILKLWTIDRFFYLAPLLWMLLFAQALSVFNYSLPRYVLVALALVSIQYGGTLVCSNELLRNVWTIAGKDFGEPVFKNFYATDLFISMESDLHLQAHRERVGCVALHPAVPQYNGVPTIDGYLNNYPLAYKHSFRALIQYELQRTPTLQRYYDGWGSRAYIYCSELTPNQLLGKNNHRTLSQLLLNYEALMQLHCAYIISAIQIDNATSQHLSLVKKYTSQNSFYNLYVYKVE